MRPLLTFLLAGFLLAGAHAQRISPATYIECYAPLSTQLMHDTGIPASVILGIAMVESASGNSRICRLLNNHFGIKGPNSLREKGSRVRSRYREYESDTASYLHFCSYIAQCKFFPLLKGKTRYLTWLKKINTCGYARSKKRWLTDVAFTIRKYKLHRFDTAVHEQ